MQTVTFQCGHCHKLMGVSSAFLGQQVRCPHCQQVVVAPATPPAPSPAPLPPPAPLPSIAPAPVPVFLDPTIAFDRGEEDSIFSPPAPSDDLFDAPAPRLELPSLSPSHLDSFLPPTEIPLEPVLPIPTLEPAPPIPTLEPTVAVGLPPMPALDATQAFVPQPVEQTDGATAVLSQDLPQFLAPVGDGAVVGLLGGSEAPVEPEARHRPQRHQAEGSNLVFWIIILSLFSLLLCYSAFTTYLLLRQSFAPPPNLLDQMPDVNGDSPGGKKKKAVLKPDFFEKRQKAQVPASQMVKLGDTLRIGDLEVTPEKVERRKVGVYVQGWDKPEPCRHPSLVLHLHLKNVSSDFSFAPLDNYFDRKPVKGDVNPFTRLDVGDKPFYGGPAPWYPPNLPASSNIKREWIEGRQKTAEYLAPGMSAIPSSAPTARTTGSCRPWPATPAPCSGAFTCGAAWSRSTAGKCPPRRSSAFPSPIRTSNKPTEAPFANPASLPAKAAPTVQFSPLPSLGARVYYMPKEMGDPLLT